MTPKDEPPRSEGVQGDEQGAITKSSRKNVWAQEIPVGTQEESGILCFPYIPGLTPQVSLECNPEIPVAPGEEH